MNDKILNEGGEDSDEQDYDLQTKPSLANCDSRSTTTGMSDIRSKIID